MLHTIRPEAFLRSTIGLLAILLCFSFPDQVVLRSTEFLKPILGDRISWLLCSFPTLALLALWYWMTTRRRRMAEIGPDWSPRHVPEPEIKHN
jgi:hypothetical protein